MSATVASTTIRRTTRARKTSVSPDIISAVKTDSLIKSLKTYEESFVNLFNEINASKEEFSSLQKEIADIKELWIKEQKDHEVAIAERNQQEDIARKREKETYDYETILARKKEEDEIAVFKKALEEATAQLKDVAVKVIESSGNKPQANPAQES